MPIRQRETDLGHFRMALEDSLPHRVQGVLDRRAVVPRKRLEKGPADPLERAVEVPGRALVQPGSLDGRREDPAETATCA